MTLELLCRWRYSPGTIPILAILYSVYFYWLSLWVLHSWTSRGKNGGRPTSFITWIPSCSLRASELWHCFQSQLWMRTERPDYATFVVITLAADLGNTYWHCPLPIPAVRKSIHMAYDSSGVYLYQVTRVFLSKHPAFDTYHLTFRHSYHHGIWDNLWVIPCDLDHAAVLTSMLQIVCSSIIICRTCLRIKQLSRGWRSSWGRNTTVIGRPLPIVCFFVMSIFWLLRILAVNHVEYGRGTATKLDAAMEQAAHQALVNHRGW